MIALFHACNTFPCMVYFSMTDSAMFVYINDDTCKGNDWL